MSPQQKQNQIDAEVTVEVVRQAITKRVPRVVRSSGNTPLEYRIWDGTLQYSHKDDGVWYNSFGVGRNDYPLIAGLWAKPEVDEVNQEAELEITVNLTMQTKQQLGALKMALGVLPGDSPLYEAFSKIADAWDGLP